MQKNDMRINISMIMYGGLSYGGAHRQTIRLACELDKNLFNITYFWCKPNPDLNSTFIWPELDYSNIQLLEENGIKVIEFHSRTRDISKKYHPWIDSNFFEKYLEVKTDLVFSSRGGYPEYPFFMLKEPVIEWNIFGCFDPSNNLVHSVSISDWAHSQWKKEGMASKSEIIYPAVPGPADADSLRSELGIKENEVIFGFHQRNDEHIYGEHALRAYAEALKRITNETKFIILGGSEKYRELAKNLQIDVIFLPIAKNYLNVSRFLKTIDVFAHSGGAGEAHGTVIQEAMMHGLPSITMLIPGRPDGQVGTMANTGIVTKSIGEYASAIKSFADDKELRCSLGRQAMETAADRYSLEKVSKRFERLFIEQHTKYKNKKFSRLNPVYIDFLLESNKVGRYCKARIPQVARRFLMLF